MEGLAGPEGLALLEPKAVLLLWIGRLGDFLVSTPFLAAARARWPAARLAVVTGVRAREALALSPGADVRWTLHPPHRPDLNAALLARVALGGFDLAVDLNPAYSRASGLLTLLSRAPARVSFLKPRAAWFYTHVLPFNPDRDNMVLSYGRLARAFDAPFQPRLGLRLGDEALEAADRRLKASGADPGKFWLAVHPGNFKKVENRWPEEKFVKLTRRLLGTSPDLPDLLEVFFIAGPGEQEPVRRIAAEVPGSRVLDPMPVAESAAALSRMDLLVANSTGTMHLAASVGTPTFALFSRYTSLVWSLPEGPHAGASGDGWEDCRDLPVERAYEALLPAFERARDARRPRILS